jgi:hypothetical protein
VLFVASCKEILLLRSKRKIQLIHKVTKGTKNNFLTFLAEKPSCSFVSSWQRNPSVAKQKKKYSSHTKPLRALRITLFFPYFFRRKTFVLFVASWQRNPFAAKQKKKCSLKYEPTLVSSFTLSVKIQPDSSLLLLLPGSQSLTKRLLMLKLLLQ